MEGAILRIAVWRSLPNCVQDAFCGYSQPYFVPERIGVRDHPPRMFTTFTWPLERGMDGTRTGPGKRMAAGVTPGWDPGWRARRPPGRRSRALPAGGDLGVAGGRPEGAAECGRA